MLSALTMRSTSCTVVVVVVKLHFPRNLPIIKVNKEDNYDIGMHTCLFMASC